MNPDEKTKAINGSDKIEEKEAVKFKNGVIYQGQWKGDVRWGYGVQVWPDGARYEGNWVNGKANGQGMFASTKVNLYTSMEMCTKGSGLMIKPLVKEFISIIMVPSMMESGLMTTSMEKA